MATESYIERLQRERAELIEAIKAQVAWKESIEKLRNATYRGDATREADLKFIEMNRLLKIIEPYLAEKESANAGA